MFGMNRRPTTAVSFIPRGEECVAAGMQLRHCMGSERRGPSWGGGAARRHTRIKEGVVLIGSWLLKEPGALGFGEGWDAREGGYRARRIGSQAGLD